MDFNIAKWQFVVTVFLIKVPKRGSDSMLVEKKLPPLYIYALSFHSMIKQIEIKKVTTKIDKILTQH